MVKINKIINKMYLLILIALSLINSNAISSDQLLEKKVLISQVIEHPAFTATINGIIDSLAQAGYIKGKNLKLRCESAQASPTIAAQIASKFVNQNPDVVVGVGTIAAQSFIKYTASGKTRLIFSSITDPIEANLVKSLTKPNNNASGVSNFVALEPQIKLFKRIQPNLKRLGFIYNPGEINSTSIAIKLEQICKNFDIALIKQAITKTADVAQNAVKLAMQTDAIFISNDSTALSSLQSIIKAANIAKIPVYVSDIDAVKFGAMAALGPNQYEIGIQTGKIITRILRGEDINSIPVEFPKSTKLYINMEAAKKLSIDIPQLVLKKATIITKSK